MNHEKCVRARGVEGERARLTGSVRVLIGGLVGGLGVYGLRGAAKERGRKVQLPAPAPAQYASATTTGKTPLN